MSNTNLFAKAIEMCGSWSAPKVEEKVKNMLILYHYFGMDNFHHNQPIMSLQ